MNNLILPIAGILAGLIVGYIARYYLAARKRESLERSGEEKLRRAKDEAQDIVLQAKNKAVSVLDEAKTEEKKRRSEIEKAEESLLKRSEMTLQRENEIAKERIRLVEEEKSIMAKRETLRQSEAEIADRLTKIAGLTPEEAKERMLKEVRDKYQSDLVEEARKILHDRREEIEKKSVEVMTTAIQRYARAHVSEITTSSFVLPSEDFKGKIIGREGRNIRTLERLTGVELIVDESPDTIIISSFDPMRREVARLSLEKLVKDGRIQPAKIEEKVDEAKAEIEKRVQEIGEEAAYEVGVYGLPKEILNLLGRLNFRTSFGQNVLNHSVEMAHIAGMIAAELGVNVDITKKAALVHDIGKAIDHEVQGTHVELGRRILKKYGVEESVIRGMEAHHEDYPFSTPESYIVTAADILSAARPGARRGTVENYVKRLEDLEKIAKEFKGVRDAYAIQAGRELRVFVVPEQIDDFMALQLAKDIASKIEADLKYPGEIKVNVIRELRAVEYAK
ncbi:MAG: ribonuclease Y [Patescibacteria group bacterium]|nr:ribonuclease Y [Patescibacteria group bacterium]